MDDTEYSLEWKAREALWFETQLEELTTYSETRFGATAPEQWKLLCDSLRVYESPPPGFMLTGDRKWELVSALQKSIRRGNKAEAHRCAAATRSMPEQNAYFWRRFCVIACEDVGPADELLAVFVVACATVFGSKKNAAASYHLFCFLAAEMCEAPHRSRAYCSYSIIEAAMARSALPEQRSEDHSIIATILECQARIASPKNCWQQWVKTHDWRAERILRFVNSVSTSDMVEVSHEQPVSHRLCGLPSYCYDMHTRVGLAMLTRIVRGVPGAEAVRDLFRKCHTKSPHRVLGEALFFVEGGYIRNELRHPALASLEQRLFAHQSGMSLEAWSDLKLLTTHVLNIGIIDRVREEVLQQFYGQRRLQLIATEDDPPAG